MKKFRLLSSLLSALMVLSVFTAIPAGAAKLDSTTLFCDFETFEEGSVSTTSLKAEGLTGYNTSMGESSTTTKIVAEEDGNKAAALSTTTGHLYVDAPSVLTSGKAYIGFSLKGDSYQYVKVYFEQPRSSDSATGVSRYIGEYVANIESGIAAANSSSGTLASPTARDSSKWCNVKIVVDIDNDTWTIYLDGKSLGTYEFSKDITEFYGFSFYEGYISGSGMVDNISIICDETGKDAGVKLFTSDTVIDENGNTVITAAFSEAINVQTDDIKVTKCGSTDEITVADVTSVGTKLTIILDGSPDVGSEYVVTFEGYEDIELYLYTPPENGKMQHTPMMTFEDIEADTSTSDNFVKNNDEVYKILSCATGNEAISLSSVEERNVSVGDTEASGNVISTREAAGNDWYLLDIIESDTGIETYEFDFLYYYTGNSTLNIKCQESGETLYQYYNDSSNSSRSWKHMRIDYDTAGDTLTATVDGVVYKTLTDVTEFNEPLLIPGGSFVSRARLLSIDNYESYVVSTPMAIEKVRYTDADGKVTGTNNISPEITQIDITFSGAIDDIALDSITLTADGEPVVSDNPDANGKVVTLTVPGMLPGDADIELIIPAGLKTIDGQVLAEDKIYNVTTKEGKFEVSDLSLELNYDTVTSAGTTGADGDTVVITADVINTASMGKKLTLIYALYNDNELVDINFEDVTINSNQYAVSITTDALTTKSNVEYDTVKAFVWNGLDGALSQTPAVSYPVQ